MAGGYPFLNRIKDPALYQALKAVWDQALATQAALTALTGVAVTVQPGTPLDAENERIIRVATPEAAGDAINLQYFAAIVKNLQHNSLTAIQGGQVSESGAEYYHLTAAQWATLTALAAPSSGSVAQATSKATGVTLNTQVGDITLNNANLNADTAVAFVLTNSVIAAGSVLVIDHISGGTLGSYLVTYTPAGGSATITVRNITPGNLAEAPVLRFLVLPGF